MRRVIMYNDFEEYEKKASILEKIAKNYPSNSEEYDLLKRAGFALFFSTVEHKEEFEKFMQNIYPNGLEKPEGNGPSTQGTPLEK